MNNLHHSICLIEADVRAIVRSEMEDPTSAGEREQRLEDALLAIRGTVLGPLKPRECVCLINEIVGEALFDDFAGTMRRGYESGTIMR